MRVQLAKVISQCLYLLDLINRRQTGTDLGTSGRNIEETLDGLVKQVCEQAKRLRVSIVVIYHKLTLLLESKHSYKIFLV